MWLVNAGRYFCYYMHVIEERKLLVANIFLFQTEINVHWVSPDHFSLQRGIGQRHAINWPYALTVMYYNSIRHQHTPNYTNCTGTDTNHILTLHISAAASDDHNQTG